VPILRNLRRIRELRAWSQVDLSQKTGIAQRTISELESGRRSPQPRTTRKLARALKVDPAELIGDQL
jgi:transcriptional regulator with XRE-family HTH domain